MSKYDDLRAEAAAAIAAGFEFMPRGSVPAKVLLELIDGQRSIPEPINDERNSLETPEQWEDYFRRHPDQRR